MKATGVSVRFIGWGAFALSATLANCSAGGGDSGAVGVTPFSIEREGRSQLCRTNGGYSARLQR